TRRTGALDQRVNDALDVEFDSVDRAPIALPRAPSPLPGARARRRVELVRQPAEAIARAHAGRCASRRSPAAPRLDRSEPASCAHSNMGRLAGTRSRATRAPQAIGLYP